MNACADSRSEKTQQQRAVCFEKERMADGNQEREKEKIALGVPPKEEVDSESKIFGFRRLPAGLRDIPALLRIPPGPCP